MAQDVADASEGLGLAYLHSAVGTVVVAAAVLLAVVAAAVDN